MMRTPHFSRRMLLTAFLLLMLLPATAGAQNRGDGTVYSRFGLGELEDFASSQVAAMGGGGYALRSLNYTGFANPALWSDQMLVRASFGVTYEEVSATNAAGETSRLSEGALNSVQLSFPVLSRELGVGLAYRPYSRANYRVSTAGQLEVAPDSLVGYDVNVEGDGGLQQITGGAGYRVSDALSLGATVDVIFGIVENTRTTTFPDHPFDFGSATRTDGTRLVGVTGTLGGLLSLKSVLAEDDVLSIGAAFTLPTRLQGERVLTLGRSLDADTLSTRSGEADLPWRAGLGLAYKPDSRWAVLLDGSYAPWSSFESSLDLPGQSALANRARVSAGAEFLPAGEDLIEPFLRRTAYRIGFYAEQSYVRVPFAEASGALRTSDPISVYALTGGFSFPTLLPGTHLDLNFKVGRRGTTQSGLVRDTFYGASLTVNFGERWFQQRRLR